MRISRVNRAVRDLPRVAAARRVRRAATTKRVVIFGLLVAVIFGSAVYALYRPEVNIQKVEVFGTNVLKPAEIGNAVEAQISGKYFHLIPKRNIFFYPHDQIIVNLRNEFKRISTLSVERSGFTKLAVRLTERPERYLWCGRDFVEERGPDNDCYFVDSGGYVFSLAPFYSGNLFFEFYGPLATGENARPLGGAVLSEDQFNVLIAFSQVLDEFDLRPTKILVKTDGDYEFTLPETGRLLVSSKNDLMKKAEYLELALKSDPLKTKMDKERANLDYIDLRFGNKVYYKFK